MRLRGPGRRDHFLVRGIGPTVSDIALDRVGEQQRGLQHDPDLTAQRDQIHAADIHAVDQQFSLAHIVETRDQVDQRRLARPRGADQRHNAIRLDLEVDSTQGGGLFILIFQPHLAEFDLAAQRLELNRIHRRLDGRLCVQHFEDALCARRCFATRVDQSSQRLGGLG